MIAFSSANRAAQVANNLHCLMSRSNLSIAATVEATGVDYRTLHGILEGKTRAQAKTIHKLAAGLGVDASELLVSQDPRFAFDRATNPAVARAVDAHPKVFRQWRAEDFEELFSRVGAGGALTEEAALAVAKEMNLRREVLRDVMLIMESAQAPLFREFVKVFFKDVTGARLQAAS